MLTLMHQNAHIPPQAFPMLESFLTEPFPHTPQDMMQLEQRLARAAAQTADQILLVQVTRAHEDEAFVRGFGSCAATHVTGTGQPVRCLLSSWKDRGSS